MKKILSLLSLAALTVGLLASCSKIDERISNLEKRIDGIESNQIASIKSQVDAINTSIADLGTIRQNVQALMNTTPSKENIEELRKADEALGRRIDELKSYTDGELTKYATIEWVKATFATLEQHQWTCDTIAKIDARIGALDAKLSQSISGLESSLKQWVNEQLDAYYTAAQMDAKLDVMRNDINNAKAQGKTATDKADSLATELTTLKTAVDTAKANIRNEYKAAVQSAIETSEGKLTKALQDSIAKVNGKIAALDTRVTTLEGKVLALEGNVNKLLAMIQSVSITPAYSDGSVEAVDGILTLKCIVSPAKAISGMESLKDSLLLYADSVKVKTKATTPAYMTIEVSEASVLDAAQGAITLKADISEYLPKGEGKALTVAVNVKNGISDFTTEFVPVTDIPFVDLGVKNAAGKPLYWAKCNLGADNPQDPGDYYMWGATALMYSAVDYSKTDGAFTFVTENPYGDNFKNTWDESANFDWKYIPFANSTYSGGGSSIIKKVFTKYTTSDVYAQGDTPDNLTTLKPEDDAAMAENLNWRMPTKDDFVRLVGSCVLMWTSNYNNTSKAGYIVYKAKNDADKGKACIENSTWKMWDATQSKYVENSGSEPTGYSNSTDAHIFLPVTGLGTTTKLNYFSTNGCYWTSTLHENYNNQAFCFMFTKTMITNIISQSERRNGYSIRPVTE